MKTFYVPLTLASLSLAAWMATAQEPTEAAPTAVSKFKIATDANNGASVALSEGEVLVVRLKENPSTGYSRALVSFPEMPIRLLSHHILPAKPVTENAEPVIAAPVVGEWRFAVSGKAKFGRAMWLKFLQLRPFAKGIENANLWEIKVTVPPTPADGIAAQ